MNGRRHTREFKLQVCRQIASGQKRPAQVCREHQLANSLLSRWRAEYAARGEQAFAAAPEPTEADIALRDAIERIVLACPGYGYRRGTAELHRQGQIVNHKRVLRLMRQEALLCQLKRHFVVTTNSQHGLPTYPNLLAEAKLTALNQALVADITYIHLPRQFVYLAAILDAYSRYCVGWHLSAMIDTQLTLQALEMALAHRSVAPGWDPPLGSGRAVRLDGLRGASDPGRSPYQHVSQGQSLRQC